MQNSNDDYVSDVDRQDQIAIEERKKEKEERKENKNEDEIFCYIEGYLWKDEIKTVREFINANCKRRT